MNKELKKKYPIGYSFTGLAALLVGIGIGRFGYPPLIPEIINQKWFTIAQADYLGAANLTGYIIGSMIATLLNRYIPSVTLIRVMLLFTAITSEYSFTSFFIEIATAITILLFYK